MIMGKLMNEFRKLEVVDFKYILLFLLGAFPAFILRRFKKDIWLISERYDSAEDNC